MNTNETWTLTEAAERVLNVSRSTGAEKIDVKLIRCG
jgi:hypothetical protein